MTMHLFPFDLYANSEKRFYTFRYRLLMRSFCFWRTYWKEMQSLIERLRTCNWFILLIHAMLRYALTSIRKILLLFKRYWFTSPLIVENI